MEGLIKEFEFVDGKYQDQISLRKLSSSLDGADLTAPVKTCREQGQSMVVIGKPWNSEVIDRMLDFAEMCTVVGVVCHFCVHADDLNRKTSVDIVEKTSEMGHVIMIEPATASKPSQLTPRALLAAVQTSANKITQVLGKRPTLVRVCSDKLSVGQMESLQRENFIPVYACEQSKGYLFDELSRYGALFLKNRIRTLIENGVMPVAADLCTGFAPYISTDTSQSF